MSISPHFENKFLPRFKQPKKTLGLLDPWIRDR